MDKHEAQAKLAAINITEFAKRSKVALRTLWRLKMGQGNPTKGTLMLLKADLKRLNPQPVCNTEDQSS